jgi:hypothetical protein
MKKKLLYTLIALGSLISARGQEEITKAAEAYRAAGQSRTAINGEFFQATIKMGAAANQFQIFLKPNTNVGDLVIGFPNAIIAGGAPGVAFSVPGVATFTPTYHLQGGMTFSNVTENVGGRSRIAFNTNAATGPLTLPWPAGEERLAYTITINGDDTVGLRMEHDMLGISSFAFYMAEQNTASDWTNITTPFYAFGSGAVVGTEGNFIYVTLGSSIITPVTFKDYNAKCNDKGTLVTWTTAMEANTSHYEIEKSVNGQDWVKIDQVAAAGNSSADRAYQYLDLESGRAFYRLKQVDLDGSHVYTAVASVNCEPKKTSVALFPVPAKDKITVVINSTVAARTDLQIFDMNGKLVRRTSAQVNSGNNNFVLNVSDLPNGQYMLASTDPSMQFNKKFTINR